MSGTQGNRPRDAFQDSQVQHPTLPQGTFLGVVWTRQLPRSRSMTTPYKVLARPRAPWPCTRKLSLGARRQEPESERPARMLALLLPGCVGSARLLSSQSPLPSATREDDRGHLQEKREGNKPRSCRQAASGPASQTLPAGPTATQNNAGPSHQGSGLEAAQRGHTHGLHGRSGGSTVNLHRAPGHRQSAFPQN